MQELIFTQIFIKTMALPAQIIHKTHKLLRFKQKLSAFIRGVEKFRALHLNIDCGSRPSNDFQIPPVGGVVILILKREKPRAYEKFRALSVGQTPSEASCES